LRRAPRGAEHRITETSRRCRSPRRRDSLVQWRQVCRGASYSPTLLDVNEPGRSYGAVAVRADGRVRPARGEPHLHVVGPSSLTPPGAIATSRLERTDRGRTYRGDRIQHRALLLCGAVSTGTTALRNENGGPSWRHHWPSSLRRSWAWAGSLNTRESLLLRRLELRQRALSLTRQPKS
jgi:hypothetical protein